MSCSYFYLKSPIMKITLIISLLFITGCSSSYKWVGGNAQHFRQRKEFKEAKKLKSKPNLNGKVVAINRYST